MLTLCFFKKMKKRNIKYIKYKTWNKKIKIAIKKV